MTEKSPSYFHQNDSPGYGADSFRQILQFLAGVGSSGGNLAWPSTIAAEQRGVVLRPAALKVSVSSGLTLSIAAGACIVGGSRSTDQGGYFCYNHGAKSLALSSAPSAGNTRIDAVIAQVIDAQKIGSGSDSWVITKVDGTPTTGTPSPPDLSAMNDIVVLAHCTVNSSGVVTNIADRRRVATLDGPPIGSLHDWAAGNVPHGYLACDGASYATSDYPDLFAIIGYTFGGAAANFNVPDLRGRATVGLDDMGTSAGDGGRLAAANTLGGTGGEEKHTLTQAELPATVSETLYANGATNLVAARQSGQATGGSGVTSSTIAYPLGSGTAMNNMPPYLLTTKLIRAY